MYKNKTDVVVMSGVELKGLEVSPLVSIVIPTYNRARLLRRAIQSVLNQTYQNFELIIVDDYSTDNTESMVKSFRDDRIRYLQHSKNRGAVAARNTGIKAAKGEYIAFQDSDDVWLPEKLDKQIRAFISGSPSIGVVYTSYLLLGENGDRFYYPPSDVKLTEGDLYYPLLECNFIGTPTAVVKKACFEKVGVFENFPRLQEWSLWLRISRHFCFRHIDEPLVIAYTQPDSISHNLDALIAARKLFLTKYFVEISRNSRILRRHYFEIGTFLFLNKETKSGRDYFFRAIATNPFDIKLILSAFTSLFGLKAYNKAVSIYLQTRA
jgi:glycosyltransferase involved in cell wall biosynthesis